MITDLIRETGLLFAYHHFAEGESPDPPFLIYLFPESNNYGADNTVYAEVSRVYLELYTDCKDPETEKQVERALQDHGIFWDKSEVWIESESLYEVLYSFETEV